jgi:hypothetical protein
MTVRMFMGEKREPDCAVGRRYLYTLGNGAELRVEGQTRPSARHAGLNEEVKAPVRCKMGPFVGVLEANQLRLMSCGSYSQT